jgi:uncharacterized protein (TIGR02246 family)
MSRASTSAALAAVAVLALLAVLGPAGCTPTLERQKPTPATDARTEVQALFENYVDALNRSDTTGVLEAYAPDSQVTVAGRGVFLRGHDAIGKTLGEGLLNMGQNTYDIDSLDVIPIERAHALAFIVYTVEPSDQDIPDFHFTATYFLEKSRAKWQIVHAHMCSAREL